MLAFIDMHMKIHSTFMIAVAIAVSMSVALPAHAGKAGGWTVSGVSNQVAARDGLSGYGRQGGRQNQSQTYGMPLMQYAAALVPLGQVLDAINAQVPGNQLDTNTVVEGGRTIYVVRWQAARGRIIIFRVDAENGQIIGRQG
jgi:uncharacterized membrane protein YkoI